MHLRLRELIATGGEITVAEPVITEVLAGAWSDGRESDLRRLLSRFELLHFDSRVDFDGAAQIYGRCRGRGITPRGIVDCMIAAVAWRHRATRSWRCCVQEGCMKLASSSVRPPIAGGGPEVRGPNWHGAGSPCNCPDP